MKRTIDRHRARVTDLVFRGVAPEYSAPLFERGGVGWEIADRIRDQRMMMTRLTKLRSRSVSVYGPWIGTAIFERIAKAAQCPLRVPRATYERFGKWVPQHIGVRVHSEASAWARWGPGMKVG